MSVELLKTMQSAIIHKLEPASIANIADILFAYSTASPDMLEEIYDNSSALNSL